MSKKQRHDSIGPYEEDPVMKEADHPSPREEGIAEAPVYEHPTDVHLPDEDEDQKGPKAFPSPK